MSQRWYYLLQPREGKKALLSSERISTNNILVCLELKNRSFTRFSHYCELGRYLKKCIEANRCLYEVILAEQRQKPYFDFDFDRRKEEFASLSEEGARQYIQKFVVTIRQICSHIEERDVIITESHGLEKFSFHVTIDRWCFPDNLENRAFFEKIMITLGEIGWKKGIDATMYKSIQQFRILGCHKYRSSRTKQLSPISTWRDKLHPDPSTDAGFAAALGASLISNSGYCRLLPSFGVPKPPRVLSEKEEVDSKLAPVALRLVPEHDAFQVIGIQQGLIRLKRLRPTYCNSCRRTHENENPYLLILGPEKSVIFDCRRGGKKQHLGTLSIYNAETLEQIASGVTSVCQTAPRVSGKESEVKEPPFPQENPAEVEVKEEITKMLPTVASVFEPAPLKYGPPPVLLPQPCSSSPRDFLLELHRSMSRPVEEHYVESTRPSLAKFSLYG